MGTDLQGASQAITQQSQQNSLQQQEKNAENKKQEDALKGFQQALQNSAESEAPVELAGERPAKNWQGQPARTTGLSPVLWDECELGLPIPVGCRYQPPF